MLSFVKSELTIASDLLQTVLSDEKLLTQVSDSAQLCVDTYRQSGKIMIAGNGGSAADAQHMSAEFVSRYHKDRSPLPSIAFSTDTSILTAIANDYGYDHLFSRQLEAHAQTGDVFIALSTSGNSGNIIKALEMSRQMGIKSIGFTGETGGKMKHLCDVCLCVPSPLTPRVQEIHGMLGHILCAAVENDLLGKA